MQKTLVMNAGSSSVKYALFDGALRQVMSGSATEIGGAALLKIGDAARSMALPDHRAAVAACLDALAAAGHDTQTLTAAWCMAVCNVWPRAGLPPTFWPGLRHACRWPRCTTPRTWPR